MWLSDNILLKFTLCSWSSESNDSTTDKFVEELLFWDNDSMIDKLDSSYWFTEPLLCLVREFSGSLLLFLTIGSNISDKDLSSANAGVSVESSSK